jgi:hypothetical protein
MKANTTAINFRSERSAWGSPFAQLGAEAGNLNLIASVRPNLDYYT